MNFYPEKAPPKTNIDFFLENFQKFLKNRKRVWLIGRVMALREHGKITFLKLQDFYGNVQIILKDDITKDYRKCLDLIKIGDFFAFYGFSFLPQSKEKSLLAQKWILVSKSVKSFPKEYYKIRDEELLVREPYLRTIFYPEEKEVFYLRFKLIEELRKILWQEGFLEVETPILQTHYGGALARPFITYLESLKEKLYLRIAPEIYLKKMLVGGFEKIFEIGKNFRNEGIDKEHNPEFTMMELYWAYQDREGLMKFTEKLIKELVKRSNELRSISSSFAKASEDSRESALKKFSRRSASKTGPRRCRSVNLRIEYQGKIINLGKKWPVYKYVELFRKETGLDYFENSLDDFLELAREKNIEFNPKIITKDKIADEIFKKLIRPKLIEPSFLIDHPKELSPLAKIHPDDPRLTLRFQIYLAGFEIANAFAELNDPIDQKNRFEKSAKELRKGDIEAHPYDETFISALEYGMPPTAGLGIGLDRLLTIILNRKSIQDIIYFPFVKRKEI